MSERRWCPTDLMDEAVPVLVSEPSDALRCDPAGRWMVVDEAGRELLGPFASGELVQWQFHESRGFTDLTVNEDGTFSTDGSLQGPISIWWERGDLDTISETLEDLVRGSLHQPGVYEVEAYYWSDDVPHRFEIVDGQGRFVAVEQPQ